MKAILLAYLFIIGVNTETAHSPPLATEPLALVDRCMELAEQPTFDFPNFASVQVGNGIRPYGD